MKSLLFNCQCCPWLLCNQVKRKKMIWIDHRILLFENLYHGVSQIKPSIIQRRNNWLLRKRRLIVEVSSSREVLIHFWLILLDFIVWFKRYVWKHDLDKKLPSMIFKLINFQLTKNFIFRQKDKNLKTTGKQRRVLFFVNLIP